MTKIGDVAKLIGVGTHTLRFWESKFPHIKSINNKSKTRYYDALAINEFVKIKDLMYTHGLTLSGVEKMVKDNKIKVSKVKKLEKIANHQNELFGDCVDVVEDKMEIIQSEDIKTNDENVECKKESVNLILADLSEIKAKIYDILNKNAK